MRSFSSHDSMTLLHQQRRALHAVFTTHECMNFLKSPSGALRQLEQRIKCKRPPTPKHSSGTHKYSNHQAFESTGIHSLRRLFDEFTYRMDIARIVPVVHNEHLKVEEKAFILFKGRHPVVMFITEIQSKSIQTQLNFISYAQLHVSTYFRSASVSQFLFKTN
jgi:hypothetical protein